MKSTVTRIIEDGTKERERHTSNETDNMSAVRKLTWGTHESNKEVQQARKKNHIT